MTEVSIEQLLGENLQADQLGLGADLMGDDLISGYIPERSIVHVPLTQIGDGLAGPVNEQNLVIYRDERPLAVDELGMQGPFHLEISKYARHRAGRAFPLNYDYGAGFDPAMYEREFVQDMLNPSPLNPGQLPDAHDGVSPVEVLGSANTVFYTASPNVGWEGY